MSTTSPPTSPVTASDRYKWVALSNTTLGTLMATLDGSIVIIAMPAIFRGIHLDPLAPGNISYLLWLVLGYLLVSAVLVVPLGRLGDMYGRVRMYNLGFLIFSLGLPCPVARPVHRPCRGDVADPAAGGPGDRRRHAHG